VTLRGVSQAFAYQAVSDAAGHFHFDQVDPGSYTITSTRDGFAIQTPGRHEKPITVREDQNVTDVAVPLKPLASVGGHVLDEEGDPIILANVQAMRTTYDQGRKRLNQVAAVRSNDLGEFQFVNLDAGRYYFRVSAPPRPANLPPRTRMSRLEQAYPPTYYPTAAEPGLATAVNVAPGAEMTGIDFRLRKAPAYHIRGKVVDGITGQPALNIAVRLAPDDPELVPGGETATAVQPDGAFDLHAIVNGSYIVSAENFQNGAATFTRQQVQVDNHDVTVVLTLSAGFDVFGRAAVEGPAPAQMNAQVLLNSERPHNGAVPQAEIAQDGTFELSHVTPGAYRIAVLAGAPGLYVKSIRFGDQDVTDGRISLSQPGGALNILFGADGGQIQGSVESASGEALPNAPVTLAPAGQHEKRADLVQVTAADQYGHFSFQDLAPGDYQVFAWGDQEVDFGLIQNADFRKLLSGQAASVSVGSNGSESVQLRLISAEDIEQAMSKLP
jgi:hypothetical protein